MEILAAVLIAGLLPTIGVGSWLWLNIATVIVYDYEKGLLYKNGVFSKLLNAGTYRYRVDHTRIDTVDCRKLPFSLSGQEILTRDLISVRITTVGNYQVTDPVKAVRDTASYMAELYTLAQLALRDCVGEVTLDQLLENKSALDAKLFEKMSVAAKDLGVTMATLAIRDVMLPANLKRAFAGALEAQKDAQRQLEVARGEQAVLRSLANSAKLYESNPSLLQARVIQALSNGNNSIVFGAEEKLVLKKAK